MDKLKLRFSGFQNGDFLSVLSRHSINSVTFSVTKISPPLDICVFRTVLRITRGKIGYMDTMFKFITPITAWEEGGGERFLSEHWCPCIRNRDGIFITSTYTYSKEQGGGSDRLLVNTNTSIPEFIEYISSIYVTYVQWTWLNLDFFLRY